MTSYETNLLLNKDKYIQRIKNITNASFPDYEFIDHSFLFAHKVKYAVPMNGTFYDHNKPEYPIFTYLFDNDPDPFIDLIIKP
ncbi:hypothetical protein GCM10023231_30210 [Olivibacter ginsenosidimutans]|uniref:Uncharacterized protein n=1 Tax=Olivibacter ginsenosidimutans TaxID=1176537 RepID=A0ABP9BRC9_9SPHI